MVMLGPRYFDKPYECDQIHFPSQDYHLDIVPLIENSPLQGFQGDCL